MPRACRTAANRASRCTAVGSSRDATTRSDAGHGPALLRRGVAAVTLTAAFASGAPAAPPEKSPEERFETIRDVGDPVNAVRRIVAAAHERGADSLAVVLDPEKWTRAPAGEPHQGAFLGIPTGDPNFRALRDRDQVLANLDARLRPQALATIAAAREVMAREARSPWGWTVYSSMLHTYA